MSNDATNDSEDSMVDKESTLWTLTEISRNEWHEYAIIREPNFYSLVGNKNEIDHITMFIESLQCEI